MSKTTRPYNEIDDYIAAFSYEERQEYAAAEKALNLIIMLYRIRKKQGTRQQHDAERAGVKRQAISHLGKAAPPIQLGTLPPYLGALGYRSQVPHLKGRGL